MCATANLMILCVQPEILENCYSGKALLPVKADAFRAALIAEDAVREIALQNLQEEVAQQVTLRNTGDKPVQLQVEHTLLGATQAKLSKDILAPGENATLDLRLKWRTILRGKQQNVLVSLKTNDPIMPRLQLAFVLRPMEGVSLTP